MSFGNHVLFCLQINNSLLESGYLLPTFFVMDDNDRKEYDAMMEKIRYVFGYLFRIMYFVVIVVAILFAFFI